MSVIKNDLDYIASVDFVPWEKLQGKTVLITGATGLIGGSLVRALLYANNVRKLNLKVIAWVRDLQKASESFAEELNSHSPLSFISSPLEEFPHIDGPVDFIIHGASQTTSRGVVEQPYETIMTAFKGTEHTLRIATDKHASGYVYLSSMEIYGHPERGHKVTESDIGLLIPADVRNSYPIAKLQCEALCAAYAREFDVPAMSVRLTQTFGPGVKYDDGRIFAYFGRCVKEHRDIVLKTKGDTERSYLYTADAVTAILTVLLKGDAGQSYNAADEKTYCSIAQMAQQVADFGGVKVRFEIEPPEKNGYPETLYMDLDTRKLRSLGWQARCMEDGGGYSIIWLYERMLSSFIR